MRCSLASGCPLTLPPRKTRKTISMEWISSLVYQSSFVDLNSTFTVHLGSKSYSVKVILGHGGVLAQQVCISDEAI